MMGPDVELLEGEQLMVDAHELAYRQITPKMYTDDGKIASHVFGPSSSDQDKPSYSRASVVTAQESRDWHSANASTPSAGVWAVSVGEVVEAKRHVVDDSKTPLEVYGIRAPGHCFVDFRGLNRGQKKELRASLLMCALRRGEIPTEEPLADGQLFL
ncbi:hypothetical protein SAMN06295974_1306 [Plantibacter flavus]|uniref:Uncharacterized protein n=1 Tax=Plantibacter flavus TaxID=150123 RepID=A0A3N2C7G0_9MICO|nr:hypothetical protein [Plantibacter flavus]ROR83244.1 hypothetical protein EDD42_3351 [Plantibacter flavus]SMG21832.1 hypothetical protein SAMN06295974_1306 [Plantibacter flavus]